MAVQEAEIRRREKELIATVLTVAEVERKRIETLSGAERQRRVLPAIGQAESVRLEADIERVQGSADAEIILSEGSAEADAMQVKPGAYGEYK